jgi:predicted Ser/Thr protein kinase
MSTETTCPQCHVPLPPDAPVGLCPRCLIRSAAGLGDPPPGAADVDFPDIGDAADVARRLPQFEIIELLGKGGMGVVYKARQLQLDRLVALKILPPVDALTPDFVERFRREARALAKLNHPNIVHVYECGEQGGLYYFVMEFVDGTNLRTLLQAKRLTPAEALAIVPHVCDALEYAHEEGIIHRDIKPENLLIDKKGRVKIADFGLAKLLRREAMDVTLTVSGTSLGTLRYMAPEQMEKPETVDHRADIYSLGVVIYEMLTGEIPMGRFAPPSERAQVDVKLDEIVLHALERDVERRYQHASEIKTDVERVTSKPSPQATTGRVSEAPPSLQQRAALQSTADFRKGDAKGILRVVMAILVSLSVIGAAAGVVGFARVIVPSFRPDTIRGAVETLGRDVFQFIGMLILSLMGLFLLPKAMRQGRDRLARVVAFDLVIMGAMLTLACEKHWFGPAVPYWVGGLVSIAAFVCWIVLRGKDVRAAFASPEKSADFEPAGETGVPTSSSEVTPSQPTRHLLSACLVLLTLFCFFFGFSFQAKHSGTAAGVAKIITVGALDPLFTSESGPLGFQTGFNFFSWSFFAVVVSGIAFGALWRIGREDQGKVPRDPAWWRDWWKQVGIWGGLVLVACIVRTVMHPDQVLAPPGQRTVDAQFAGKQTTEGNVTYLEGHTSAVKAVSVSPDGRTLVSVGTDGRVIIRDFPSGKLRRIAMNSSHPKSAPIEKFRCAAILADNAHVLVGGDQGSNGLLRIDLFKNQIEQLAVPNEFGATINDLKPCDYGAKLAYLTTRGTELNVYDMGAKSIIAQPKIFPGKYYSNVHPLTVSPDGAFVAVTSSNMEPRPDGSAVSAEPCKLTVFDMQGVERFSWQFADYADFAYAQVAFIDTRTLVVCLPSGQLQRFKLDDAWKWQTVAETVRIKPGSYIASAVSRDGKIIWLAEGNSITGIDSTTGKGVAFIELKIGEKKENYSGFAIEQIAVTNEPLTIAVALWDGRVALAKCWPLED